MKRYTLLFAVFLALIGASRASAADAYLCQMFLISISEANKVAVTDAADPWMAVSPLLERGRATLLTAPSFLQVPGRASLTEGRRSRLEMEVQLTRKGQTLQVRTSFASAELSYTGEKTVPYNRGILLKEEKTESGRVLVLIQRITRIPGMPG